MDYYNHKQKESILYLRINQYPFDWTISHLILILGVLLIIPSMLAINYYMYEKKGHSLVQLGTFLIFIGIFSLFGQFVIDLILIDVFSLEKDSALAILDKIQSNALIQVLFYDLAACWFIGQLLLGIGLTLSKSLPRWAMILLFGALTLLILGPTIHTLIGRTSYMLLSLAFFPITKYLNWSPKNRIEEERLAN